VLCNDQQSFKGMLQKMMLFIFLIASNGIVNAQHKDSIPAYSTFLKEIEEGDLDIDYRQFRISYIYSKEFKNKTDANYYNLKDEVFKYIQKKRYKKILDVCHRMLKVDYTSMFAHKYIQQTAKIIGDTLQYKKHHDIEFGLLKSIVHNGDGKSCETAWEVTQIEEEYFILRMMRAQLNMQMLDGGCDRMEVTQDNKEKVVFFGIYYVFESRVRD